MAPVRAHDQRAIVVAHVEQRVAMEVDDDGRLVDSGRRHSGRGTSLRQDAVLRTHGAQLVNAVLAGTLPFAAMSSDQTLQQVVQRRGNVMSTAQGDDFAIQVTQLSITSAKVQILPGGGVEPQLRIVGHRLRPGGLPQRRSDLAKCRMARQRPIVDPGVIQYVQTLVPHVSHKMLHLRQVAGLDHGKADQRVQRVGRVHDQLRPFRSHDRLENGDLKPGGLKVLSDSQRAVVGAVRIATQDQRPSGSVDDVTVP